MDFSNAAASHAPFSNMRLVSNEYRPNPDAYDEMMAPDGSIREHWQPFLSWLQNLPPDELERRWGRVERILFENGLAFSANPMQAQRTERAWSLDAVPLILPQQEWRALEAGLDAARPTVERPPRRSLWAATAADGRQPSGPVGLRQSAILAALPQYRGPGRQLSAFLRRRSRPLAGRPLVGADRPLPVARRWGLRARKPCRHVAWLPGTVPRQQRPASRGLLPGHARWTYVIGFA